jgi:pimeloyl-ACP methyl ester carboxylesterase
MPTKRLNGVELYYEMEGDGPPLVLVHGNWGDHSTWQYVVPHLVDSFTVVTYDRRGHTQSERPPGVAPRVEHENDLAALIEFVELGPVHLAGNSFGVLVSLGLAARRPELVRSVAGHEPPATKDAAEGELARVIEDVSATMDTVAAQIHAGEDVSATRLFMEGIALGPGAWEMLPEELRQMYIGNAPAFANDSDDPAWSAFDAKGVARFPGPIMLTKGEVSPVWLSICVDRLVELVPSIHTQTFVGAGHGPHYTHPVECAEIISRFAAQADDAVVVRAAGA